MTSKEAIELIIEKLETPFYEDCYYLEEDEEEAILTIREDLEVLDHIKLLAEKYNNGELGYINFTQEVIDLLK